jgi:hypothetical protein
LTAAIAVHFTAHRRGRAAKQFGDRPGRLERHKRAFRGAFRIGPLGTAIRRFSPAINDYLGTAQWQSCYPQVARRKLRSAMDKDRRTSTEIADYVKVPDHYVWLDIGEEAEHMLAGF